MRGISKLILAATAPLFVGAAHAGEVKIAVASNFLATMEQLADDFEEETGHTARVSGGSTGKLFAQIQHGAPFDVFFAADVSRPEKLDEAGLIAEGSRFTYAVGQIALWSPEPGVAKDGEKALKEQDFEHLAIANPKTAPYGLAAKHVLEHYGVWDDVVDRTVRGENIGQTFQFVKTGNAEIGFVALSQIHDPNKPVSGDYWLPSQDLYPKVEQQAVILESAADNDAASEFMDFVRSEKAAEVIESYGYAIP